MRRSANSKMRVQILLLLLLASVITVVCRVAVMCAPAGTPYTPQTVYDLRPGNGRLGSGPARPMGSIAPDFSLPLMSSYLKTYDAAKATKVRLADFRGKMPVVLILTGYT